jgi:hypothetical protein
VLAFSGGQALSEEMNLEIPGSATLAHPGREKFAKLRADAKSIVNAGRECKIAERTAQRWAKNPAVKSRTSFLINERISDRREEKNGGGQEITFSRNDLIMELWKIGSHAENERARVTALMGLADIFLLRARCIQDLRRGVGWTTDEQEHLIETGLVPPRISALTGDVRAGDLARPESLRGGKSQTD